MNIGQIVILAIGIITGAIALYLIITDKKSHQH